MKKLCIVWLMSLMLCGCAAAPTFESVEDVYAKDPVPDPRQVVLEVPEGAQVIQGDTGRLYLCDGYEIAVQVLSAGDLDSTMRSITGFGKEALTVVETAVSELSRYECAWSAAGEGGAEVARAAVLDDGMYHYCVTVMASAQDVGDLAEQWQEILDSVLLK